MRLTAVTLSLVCALSLQAQSDHWKALLDGNKAFQGTYITFDRLDVHRKMLADGQNPRVTVLSCSDSRVPPELVFRQMLGDIFLVRSAGNVTDQLGIASIEYAIKKRWTKLLVILAHEKCGAVEEAMRANHDPLSKQEPAGLPDDERDRNLTALIEHIKKSFEGACPDPGGCWEYRTHQNALYTIKNLRERSPIIREAMANGLEVAVVYYKLDGTLAIWKEPGKP